MITPAMSRRAALAMANARLDPDARDMVYQAAKDAADDAAFTEQVKDILPAL